MNEARPGARGSYLYAVIAGGDERSFGRCGISDAEVYSIAGEGISAVVSRLRTEDRLRPERRHLAAHQRVVDELMKTSTPLPVSFGVVADSDERVRGVLAAQRQALLERLRRVQGKAEMTLRVSWRVDNIFEFFVAGSAELRRAREDLFGGGAKPSTADRIALGKLFERTLEAERARLTGLVEEALARRGAEIERNSCRAESEVMDLACLVERDAADDFAGWVAEAAESFDDAYRFEYSGPWVPYHFVNLRLEL